MKRLLVGIMLLAPFVGYADQAFLKPLWQEEEHFAYYRVICIEGSVSTLGNLIIQAREEPQNLEKILRKMELEVQNCKNCL